jgi:LEA14-like dessication related protein
VKPRSPRFARLAVVALGLALAFTSGCAKKPTMKLHHAEVSGVQVGFPPSLSVVLTVVVDVTNPNSYDVAIRAMRGQVVIMDKYTVPIDFRAVGDGVWLKADSATQVRIPVSMPAQTAFALLQEVPVVPQIPFKVSGKADVTATRTFQLEKDNYEVDEQGVIARQQIEESVRATLNPFAPR